MSHNKSVDFLVRMAPSRRGGYRLARYVVLAVGLVGMMALTVPQLRNQTSPWLEAGLWACIAFFATEFIVKLWQSVRFDHEPPYQFSGGFWADLLAVVPVPVALALGVAPEAAWLLASLWVLELAAVVPGLSLLGRIVKLEARPLASVFIIFLIVLLLAGVALHLLGGARQPDKYGNLPMALWWAVTTLTTTGYGDAVPETFLGRLIAGMVMICGLGVFGLWTGILATGFASEHRRREFIRNWDLVTGVPFLRTLDAPGIIELTRMLRRLDVAEHSVIVRRGRPGDCMYFIASGEVEVEVEPNPIRLGAGSFFGEFALLDGSPRSATVVTTMPTTLLILDVTDFRAFTAQHPTLAKDLEAEALRRRSDAHHNETAN